MAASSPVFEAMFYGNFSHDMTNSVLITDTSYETFELFMDYIYTGELKLKTNDEIDSLVSVSYCAQKYLVDELRKLCVKKLGELLNRNNIFHFLAKSFEYHLEDFLVSCLYFFVDFIEAGTSFCNTILNANEDIHLSSQCFEFLAKNLLDYFGERDNILCLIKAWTIKACHDDNLSACDESLAVNTKLLNLDNALCMKILQLKAGFVDLPSSSNERIAKSFHRVYYKPVRPFIVEKDQYTFDVNISFKRFISIKSLTVNSRLIPEHFDICDINNQTYTENLDVEIFEKSSNKSIYKQHHIIENVGYNESFRLKFNDRMILFPYHAYVIKFTWNDEVANGYEYPRAIFSLLEKEGKVDSGGNPQSVVQFHEYNYCYNLPVGSIVQGIFYDVIS